MKRIMGVNIELQINGDRIVVAFKQEKQKNKKKKKKENNLNNALIYPFKGYSAFPFFFLYFY